MKTTYSLLLGIGLTVPLSVCLAQLSERHPQDPAAPLPISTDSVDTLPPPDAPRPGRPPIQPMPTTGELEIQPRPVEIPDHPRPAIPGRPPGGPDSAGLLAQGILEEEAEADLASAIQRYQQVISRFETERDLAAQALFRLAECYRKLGRPEQASVYYARVLREFPNQADLAERSRQFLFSKNPLSPSSRVHATEGAINSTTRYGNPNSGTGGYGGGDPQGQHSVGVGSGRAGASGFDGMSAGGGMGMGGGASSGFSVGGERISFSVGSNGGTDPAGDAFHALQISRPRVQPQESSINQEIQRQIGKDMETQRQALQEQMMKLEEQMARMERERRPLLMPVQPTISETLDPRFQQVARELKLAESELQTAQREAYVLERKIADAEVKLDFVTQFAAEHLPPSVLDDTRYRQLKLEFEAAVLDAAASEVASPEQTAALEGRARILRTWVQQIYLPEQTEALRALKIQREQLISATERRRQLVDELRQVLTDLERRQAEERTEALKQTHAKESNIVPVPQAGSDRPVENEPR